MKMLPKKVETNKNKYLNYLLLYNGGQTIGWSYILFQLISFYISGIFKQKSLWDFIGFSVIIFQNIALVEIYNAFSGIVRSNPFLTTFQVLSRIMVVCGVILPTVSAKLCPGLPLALYAWTITEIVRYGYYTFNLINMVPHILVWLRYSTFIVLYPIGVTGELMCFYWAQYEARDHIFNIQMPNKYNITFSYFILLWIVMFSYIPLFPQLYLHMFSQRDKSLKKEMSTKKLK